MALDGAVSTGNCAVSELSRYVLALQECVSNVLFQGAPAYTRITSYHDWYIRCSLMLFLLTDAETSLDILSPSDIRADGEQ